MSNINLTPGAVGGGKGPVAYYILRPFPDCVNVPLVQCLRTGYDCWGRSVHPKGRWKCVQGLTPPQNIFWVSGFGTIAQPGKLSLEVIHDVRTIEMIAGGCCPPAIMLDFLEVGEGPD